MAKGPMPGPSTKVERAPETVRFAFRKEKDIPDEFDGLEPGDSVRIILTGKVEKTNRSKVRKEMDYEDAASLSITQDKVKIVATDKKAASMDDAMKSAEEKRRM
jgi:hypothetical protein